MKRELDRVVAVAEECGRHAETEQADSDIRDAIAPIIREEMERQFRSSMLRFAVMLILAALFVLAFTLQFGPRDPMMHALVYPALMTAAAQEGVLLPYQARWIADRSRVKIAEKSRRTGFTWAEAADSALEAAKAHRGQDTFYISYKQEMAREFIDAVAMWARAYGLAAEEVAEFVFEDEDKDILAYRVTFASGHKVVALSSRPSNLRGMQGRVVIDEAAFHHEFEEVLTAALALIMWGGEVRIISTHNGADNPFNLTIEEVRAGKKTYSLHRLTLDDAVREGLYRKICQKLGRTWSPEAEAAWVAETRADYPGERAKEELDVIPRAGGGVYLPRALIVARSSKAVPVVRWACKDEFVHLPETIRQGEARDFCETHLLPLLKLLDQKTSSFMGGDCGRSGDLSVFWPMQVDRLRVRQTPFVLELRNVPFQQQREIAWYIADRLPRLQGVKFDARGIGAQLAEETMQRYGADVVECVKATRDWYLTNMAPFKAAFEDGLIVIPDDDDITLDLRAITVEGGIPMVRDRARSSKSGGQRHGDAAIAAVMAYAASDGELHEYGYTPAHVQRRTDERDLDRMDDDDPRRLEERAAPRGRFGRGAF